MILTTEQIRMLRQIHKRLVISQDGLSFCRGLHEQNTPCEWELIEGSELIRAMLEDTPDAASPIAQTVNLEQFEPATFAKQFSQAARHGDWIQTYTGRQFWPLDPRAEEVDILDIAQSLGMQCRFNGHASKFYSVAEHCCHVSDLLPDPLKLAGLLHDASEAYLCDLPRPLKRCQGFSDQYLIAERRLEKVIAEVFGFAYPYDRRIHDADNQVLRIEAAQLMLPLHDEWQDRLAPGEYIFNLPCWYPAEASAEFLIRFEQLKARA